MTTNNLSITERIAEKLDAFNRRLEARLRKNQELLENMRAEEDFGRSMEYFKEFFRMTHPLTDILFLKRLTSETFKSKLK